MEGGDEDIDADIRFEAVCEGGWVGEGVRAYVGCAAAAKAAVGARFRSLT